MNTANLLEANGHAVTLLVLDETATSFYPLSSRVKLVQENLHFGIAQTGTIVSRKLAFAGHIRKLRSLLKAAKPDLVLSTDYAFTIAAYFALGNDRRRLLAWEHHHFGHLTRSRFWQQLFRHVYPKLSCVVCLNPIEAKLYEDIGCKTRVIPNFITPGAKASLHNKSLLTVGWLTKLKGVDLVPAVAEKVFATCPDAQWTLIGTGPEERWLKAELANRGLSSKVSIQAPESPHIDHHYFQSALYVMLSQFECFPMVLLEAASHGVPAISFDCPTGPAAIIEQGKTGILIPQGDVSGMAQAIIRMLQNHEERTELGANTHRSIERFSPQSVLELWEALFATYIDQ